MFYFIISSFYLDAAFQLWVRIIGLLTRIFSVFIRVAFLKYFILSAISGSSTPALYLSVYVGILLSPQYHGTDRIPFLETQSRYFLIMPIVVFIIFYVE